MQKSFFIVFFSLFALSFCLESLVDTVAKDSQLSDLVQLVTDDPTVLGALQNAENVTLFAPVDPLSVDTEKLNSLGYNTTDLLSYHVVGSRNNAADFTNDETYETLTGDRIRFNAYSSPFKNVATVNGVPIEEVDIQATNGVIHKVEKVLYPPAGNVVEIASNDPDSFSTLVAVVGKASAAILQALSGDKITVFAPTNAAFEAINATLGGTLGDLDQATIDLILSYHVVGATVFSAALPDSIEVTTVSGQKFTINSGVIKSANPIATDANIITTDVLATNGVVHVIDHVLVPILETPTEETPTKEPESSATSFFISFAAIMMAFMITI